MPDERDLAHTEPVISKRFIVVFKANFVMYVVDNVAVHFFVYHFI